MMLKCICNIEFGQYGTVQYDITYGKIYESHSYSTTVVRIADDNNIKRNISKELFMELSEWRTKQLKRIGI